MEPFSVRCPPSSLLPSPRNRKRSPRGMFPSSQRPCHPSPGFRVPTQCSNSHDSNNDHDSLRKSPVCVSACPFPKPPPPRAPILSRFPGRVALFSGSSEEPQRPAAQPGPPGCLPLLAMSNRFLMRGGCQEDGGSSSKCEGLACVRGSDTALVTYKGQRTAGRGQLLVTFHQRTERPSNESLPNSEWLNWARI